MIGIYIHEFQTAVSIVLECKEHLFLTSIFMFTAAQYEITGDNHRFERNCLAKAAEIIDVRK